MVKNGQPIAPVSFRSPLHSRLPVEVIDRTELLLRSAAAHLQVQQRPSFDYLMLMGRGRGVHTVDFVDIPARAGRLVRLRAGQTHSWDGSKSYDATIVLSAPGTSTPQPWFPGDPSFTDLDSNELRTAVAVIDALQRTQRDFDGADVGIRLLVSLFDSLAALFDQSAASRNSGSASPIYLAFRTAVERDVTSSRSVAHYARSIGYSERTVTRACLRATGLTAKQVVTNRLVLEVQRRLTRSDDSLADISQQVGFSEPTNFSKFFVRHTGVTPSAFRQESGEAIPRR